MMPIEYLPFEQGVREGILTYGRRLVTFVKICLLTSFTCGAAWFLFIQRLPTAAPKVPDRVVVAPPQPPLQEPDKRTDEVRPRLRGKKPVIIAPPPIELKRPCHANLQLTGVPSDVQKSVTDNLLMKVRAVASNFKFGEGSMTFKMTFEIREDGSVANDSIQFSSGNYQFDDAVSKAVEESEFPQLAGERVLDTPVQAVLVASCPPMKHK
jgi:hypothetical protein